MSFIPLITYLIISIVISYLCFGEKLSLLLAIFDKSFYNKNNRIKLTLIYSLVSFVIFSLYIYSPSPDKTFYIKSATETVAINLNDKSNIIKLTEIINSAFTTFILVFTYITYTPNDKK